MITDGDIEAFTCGDCHILAAEIARVTGWPLCAFRDDEGEPEAHAFVRMPDGRLLDVEGAHEPDKFIKAWPFFPNIIETTYAAICRAWDRSNREEVFPDSFDRARVLARYLIREYAGSTLDTEKPIV